MTEPGFTELVYEMRAAQKDYFRRRASKLLKICKELEKKVDEELIKRKSGCPAIQDSLLD